MTFTIKLPVIVLVAIFLLINVACSSSTKRGIGVHELENISEFENVPYQDYYNKSTIISIGIDAYLYEDKLRKAVSDARAIVKLFKPIGYEAIELYNGDATHKNIIYNIKRVLEQSKPNDRIVVFYAGHGTDIRNDDNSTDGYLIPVDGNSDKISSLIPLNWLQIDLCGSSAINAKHILFILDSCSSGIVASRSSVNIDPSLRNYISALMRRPARQVITAGTGDQEVLDGGYGENSFFAGYLIQAINNNDADINNDYHITATELGIYLSQKVYMKSLGLQKPDFAKLLNTKGGEVIVKFPNPREAQLLNKRQHLYESQDGELILNVVPKKCVVKLFDLDGNKLVEKRVKDGRVAIRGVRVGDYQVIIQSESRDYLPVKLLIGIYDKIERSVVLVESVNNVVISPVL